MRSRQCQVIISAMLVPADADDVAHKQDSVSHACNAFVRHCTCDILQCTGVLPWTTVFNDLCRYNLEDGADEPLVFLGFYAGVLNSDVDNVSNGRLRLFEITQGTSTIRRRQIPKILLSYRAINHRRMSKTWIKSKSNLTDYTHLTLPLTERKRFPD